MSQSASQLSIPLGNVNQDQASLTGVKAGCVNIIMPTSSVISRLGYG